MGLLGWMAREKVAVGADRGLQPLNVALLGFSLGVSAQQVALSSTVYTLGRPTSDAPGTPLWSRQDNVLGATGSAGSLGRHLAPRGSPSLLRGAYIQTIQPLDLGDQEGAGLDQGLAGVMRLFRGGLRPRENIERIVDEPTRGFHQLSIAMLIIVRGRMPFLDDLPAALAGHFDQDVVDRLYVQD